MHDKTNPPSVIKIPAVLNVLGNLALFRVELIHIAGPLSLASIRACIPQVLADQNLAQLDKANTARLFAQVGPDVGLPIIGEGRVFYTDKDPIDQLLEPMEALLAVYFRFPRTEGAYVATVRTAE